MDGARVKAKTGKEGRPPTALGGKDSKNGRRTGGEDRETGKGKQSKQEAVKPPSRLSSRSSRSVEKGLESDQFLFFFRVALRPDLPFPGAFPPFLAAAPPSALFRN